MPRRLIVLAVLSALVAAMVAFPAEAAKKKKPVKTTMYMHGTTPLGEADGLAWLGDDTYIMKMDGTEPAGPPKSMAWHAQSVMIWNTECTGLPVGFPTWIGNVNGQIVGDVTVTLYGMGPAESITARLWTDVSPFTCNDAYVPPLSEVQVESKDGEFEVVFENIKATAMSHVLVEFLGPTPSFGRVEYDDAGVASKIEFGCIPASGSSCLPS